MTTGAAVRARPCRRKPAARHTSPPSWPLVRCGPSGGWRGGCPAARPPISRRPPPPGRCEGCLNCTKNMLLFNPGRYTGLNKTDFLFSSRRGLVGRPGLCPRVPPPPRPAGCPGALQPSRGRCPGASGPPQTGGPAHLPGQLAPGSVRPSRAASPPFGGVCSGGRVAPGSGGPSWPLPAFHTSIVGPAGGRKAGIARQLSSAAPAGALPRRCAVGHSAPSWQLLGSWRGAQVSKANMIQRPPGHDGRKIQVRPP